MSIQPYNINKYKKHADPVAPTGGNSLLGTLGSVAGTAIGGAVGGPLGASVGGSLGGQLGGTGTVDLGQTAATVAGSAAGKEVIGAGTDKLKGALGLGAAEVPSTAITAADTLGGVGTPTEGLGAVPPGVLAPAPVDPSLLGGQQGLTPEQLAEMSATTSAVGFNNGGKVGAHNIPNMMAEGFQHGPLASVEYKQSGGKVNNQMKVAYHNPLMAKQAGT